MPTAGQCSHEVVPTSFTAAFGEHTATAATPEGATAEVLRLAGLTHGDLSSVYFAITVSATG